MDKPRIPFNDLTIRDRILGGEIREAIGRVVDRGWFILGPEVDALEREMAAFLGARHAIGVACGTDAISLSLLALDIGPGAEVITSPLTATFTALGISRAGARPVFADVNPGTLSLSSRAVEARLSERTKAIVPVHLYGNPCDMSALLALARREGLRVVEDACQAHGALLSGKAMGTWGDAGCFSFYPTKNLGALGDGGMIVTDDDALASRVRRLRNGGQTSRYQHAEVGWNSRLDEIQAAVLRVKLERLGVWNRRRRELAARYDQALAPAPVSRPQCVPGSESAAHLYVIRGPRRDALRDALARDGIQTLIHYPVPAHLQPAYGHLGQERGSCPEAERAADEIVSLPLYPELDPALADEIADRVCAFFR